MRDTFSFSLFTCLAMVSIGVKLVSIVLILALVCCGVAWWTAWVAAWVAAGVLVVGAAFLAYFFRDPERKIRIKPRVLYAPADGRVIAIEEERVVPYLRRPAWKVSIFMNVFNVHVQRSPLGATVEYLQYTPGGFKNASESDAAERNERNAIGLRGDKLRVLVVQVAGLIARRIICWCSFGRELKQGERLGMIALGSRVDVYVPRRVKLKVEMGQRVKAGITVIGEIK